MTDPLQPNPAPISDGAPPQTSPSLETPPTSVSEPKTGTPEAKSPDGEPKLEGEKPADEKAPEPTPEELAAKAREAVHEDASAYTVNLDDAAKTALGLTDDDPLVASLAKFAAENKKPQGWMDNALEAAAEMAKAGVFDVGLDPAKEAEKLGENAAGRRREVEVFAEALKTRGDGFDEEMFGELMSLSPTAAGIRTVEYLRKMMMTDSQIPKPDGKPAGADDAKTKAQEMAADPRYHADRRFKAEADRAWIAAFGGR